KLRARPSLLRLFRAFFHTRVGIWYLQFDAESCKLVRARDGSGSPKSEVVCDTVPVATGLGDDLIPHLRTRFVVMKIHFETRERYFFESSAKLIDERQVVVLLMEWRRSNFYDNAAMSPNYGRRLCTAVADHVKAAQPEDCRDWDTIWVRETASQNEATKDCKERAIQQPQVMSKVTEK
uniref:PAP-associated domain-containing protein n=1 Tax=Macrostomum lignano TaxID=282301 RepID=A0A1I8H587_9PLAT